MGNWILCSEKMPEEGFKVLVTIKTRLGNLFTTIGKCYGELWLSEIGIRIATENCLVIAWQELPSPYQPPTEDKENG